MRGTGFVPVALLVAGALLVVLAVVEGGATFGVAVIVPFVVGRSIYLAIGVLLLVAGFLTLPLAFPWESLEDGAEEALYERPGKARSSVGSGGIVVVGPVPILFGSWRDVSARTRLLIAIAAAAVFVAVVLAAIVAFR